MFLALALLAGCPNVEAPPWGGGGTHYALGYAADFNGEEGGGDDTGSGGEGDGSGPELLTGSALYTSPNEAEQVFIQVGIAYEDEPDDVVGGTLYYNLVANGESQDESSRPIMDEDPDPNTDAWLDVNGQLVFQAGPVDTRMTHAMYIYIVDYTRNRSNEIAIDVTSE